MKHTEARALGQSVLDVVEELNESGVSAFRASEFSRADRYFRQALKVVRDGEETEAAATLQRVKLGLLRNLAQTHRKMGDLPRAESYYRQALRLVEPDTEAYGHLLLGLGLLSRLRGDLSAAVDWAEQALEVYRALGNDDLSARALLNSGMCLFESQQYDEAQVKLHEALRLFMRSKQKWGLAKCYTELARVSLKKDLLESGLNFAREALIVSADEGDETELGRALMVGAECYARQGRYDRVRSYIEQARALFTQERAWYELRQLCALEKELKYDR